MGEKSHDVEIAWSMDLINENTYEIEKKLAEDREKAKFLLDLSEQKIAEKHKEFAKKQNPKVFVKLCREKENNEIEYKEMDDGKSI